MNSTKEQHTPALSVIVPVYNVEQYLAECLDSILAQSFDDIEIICINDGSTDGSAEILKEYAARDNRISIITQENKGLSEARNVGVRASKGKYIFFMDSDDIVKSNAFELCVNDMERRGLEYLCFNVIGFGEELDKIIEAGSFNRSYFRRYLDENKIYSGQELFRELCGRDALIVTAWSCMVLKTAITDNNLWFHQGVLHEDEYWTFSALLSLSRCGCINEILYYNRLRSYSITQSTLSFSHIYGLFAGFCDMSKFIAEHPECIEDDVHGEPEIDRTIGLQKRAVYKYCNVDEEEQQKRFDLDPEERVLFEQTVVYPASMRIKNVELREKLKAQKAKTAELNKKNKELIKQNKELKQDKKKLKAEVKKLKTKLRKIKKSKPYRIGRIITFPFRKLGAIVRKLRRGEAPAKAPAPEVKAQVAPEIAAAAQNTIDRNTLWLLGTPEHTNMGDQFIAEEQVNFIRATLPDVKIIEYTDSQLKRQKYAQLDEIAPSQIVCLHGGGNLGNLWAGHDLLRERIIKRCKDNPIIIFPQSIFFTDDEAGEAALAHAKEVYCGDNLTLFCRDRVSFDFATENFGCRSVIVPDIVMWRAQMPEHPTQRYGALTLLRRDKERKFNDDDEARVENLLAGRFGSIEEFDMLLKSSKITQDSRKEKIDIMLGIVSSAEFVVTDRLHGMVLSAITGTPCVVFANGYYKVEACYDWIKELGYISFIRDIDELDSAIESVMSCTDRDYPDEKMQQRFAPLKEALQLQG